MVVAFFAVFIVVDAVMVTLAVKTQTGVVTEQAYEKGLAFNQTLKGAAEQEKLGWAGKIEVAGDRLTFLLQDRQGNPINGARVNAEITRPVQAGYDFSVPLEETTPYGYGTVVAFPLKGEWKIRVYATWQDKTYQSSQTVLVP